MAKKQTAALGFIFVTLLIDVIGIGIIIPIVPVLIQELTGEGLSQASVYGGWLLFAYAFMQFVFAPVLGGLSDQYGRRPVLLASLFGFAVDYSIAALAPTLSWLFVARILAGITGASFTTASAYIADISTPEKRSQNFGIIGAAFGLGFIVGPVIGGILGQFGSRVPFIAAAILSVLNWLYGYFILPESLPKEKRRAFDIKRANPLGSFMRLMKFPAIFSLAIAMFILYVAGQVNPSIWSYFTMMKFNFNEAWVGYSLGFVGLMVAIVQGGLIRIVIPLLGDWKALMVGFVFHIIGFAAFAYSTQAWMLFAFIVPFSLGGFAGPALQGIISKQVPDNEQGELQGSLTSLMSISSIVGPPIFTGLFHFYTETPETRYFPGAPFLLASIICVLAAILAIRSYRKHHSSSK
jgi:DHA1 family tetracycline resistance protein-like MFS transporter